MNKVIKWGSLRYADFAKYLLIVLSVKCLETVKCVSRSQQIDIQFTIICNSNAANLTFKELEPANSWHFCLKSKSNN